MKKSILTVLSALVVVGMFTSCQQKEDKSFHKVIKTTEECQTMEPIVKEEPVVAEINIEAITKQFVPFLENIQADARKILNDIRELTISEYKDQKKAELKRQKACEKHHKAVLKAEKKRYQAMRKAEEKRKKAEKKYAKQLKEHKTLFRWQAKRIVENYVLEQPTSVVYRTIQTGYYEEPSFNQRLELYKLAQNNIITLSCSVIEKTKDVPSYWVRVQLTEEGKQLCRRNLFPEENINLAEVVSIISPVLPVSEEAANIEVAPEDDNSIRKAYLEAKKRQYKIDYELRAYTISFNRIVSLSFAERKSICDPSVANIVYEVSYTDVTAIGRILNHVSEATKFTQDIALQYYPKNGGWLIQDDVVAYICEDEEPVYEEPDFTPEPLFDEPCPMPCREHRCGMEHRCGKGHECAAPAESVEQALDAAGDVVVKISRQLENVLDEIQ